MRACALALVLAAMCVPARATDAPLTVGSKRFTESYILGEIVAQTAARHTRAEHKPGLGNTAVVLEALKAGAIDVYPEYLGTIDAEILKNPQPTDLATMRRQLAAIGLGVGVPLGFQNTYALAMTSERATALGVRRIGDLAKHPDLVSACRTNSWVAPMVGRAWPRAIGCRTSRPASTTASPTRRWPAAHRGQRHLFHRRQDRVARPHGARRRRTVLSALRRGAALDSDTQ